MKTLLLSLLLLPAMAMADNAWHASSSGPALQNRGAQATSPTLTPTEPVAGNITQIAWRYELSSPAPSGMVVYLCAQNRCAELDGASGTTRGLTDVSATEPLHFVYGFQGTGRLNRSIRVISNAVMVNYRQK